MVECSFPPPIRPSLPGHPCRRNPGLAALESSVAALANKMSVGVEGTLGGVGAELARGYP